MSTIVDIRRLKVNMIPFGMTSRLSSCNGIERFEFSAVELY